MILYNVTINIEDEVREKWVKWMKEEHIPQVMATRQFLDHTFSKLLTRQHDETGTTYVIQYLCENMEKYEHYQEHFAPALQAETKRLFDGKFVAFRTIMEMI